MRRSTQVLVALWFAALAFCVVSGCGGKSEEPVPGLKPATVPSVESHISLLEGPKVQPTAESDLKDSDSPFEVVGERPLRDIPENLPLASPSQAGCVTKLISRNFNSRSATPAMFVLHYTVSANRDGWSDMDAIRNWFNDSRSQVSSHYIIDWEGHCYLIVPEASNAWTQGAFNSSSISIEFIATGSELQSQWASKGDAGLRKGARVTADAMKRWHIPFRYVNPPDCTVVAGVTDHNALECGNSHHDVTPNFPWTKFKRYLDSAYHGTCYRFQLRDGGKVLARSDKVKAAGRKRRLNGFLDAKDDLILKRSPGGIAVKQVKVSC